MDVLIPDDLDIKWGFCHYIQLFWDPIPLGRHDVNKYTEVETWLPETVNESD